MTRKEAAINRARYARFKIEEARQKLNEACAALCSVVGANQVYRKIRNESDSVKELRCVATDFLMDAEEPESAVALEYEPDERESKYATKEPQ